MWVEINDPGTGVLLALDIEKKTAYRVKYRGPSTPMRAFPLPGPGPIRSDGPNEVGFDFGDSIQLTLEVAPPRVIAGLRTQCRRTTLVARPGIPRLSIFEDLDKDHEEFCYSDDLWTLVLRSSTDSDSEMVWQLANVSRAEPANSLFEVPPDYVVVDIREGASFANR